MSSGNWADAVMWVLVILIIVAGMAYHDTLNATRPPAAVCIEKCQDTCAPNSLTHYEFIADTTNGCDCGCKK